MARKAKKTAVAHARAFRHTKHHPAEPNDTQPAGHDDDDAENECGYEGGVNCYWSEDSDYAPDSDSDWSDGDESVLASVSINTIRLWQHRMFRWMEAYRSGLTTRDAQLRVKQFSSARYKSHRRVPETVARVFDHV
ncbi:hypothetical protein EV424DRAFT_1511110 [Suillus variegatus]|nr:hypothetical protein EV424DRAFT_1511110 [Suillus variegatus]